MPAESHEEELGQEVEILRTHLHDSTTKEPLYLADDTESTVNHPFVPRESS